MREQIDISSAPKIDRKTVIRKLDYGGEIRTEAGSDGTYLIFDCECSDALDICKAACCCMPGTTVLHSEIPALNEIAERLQKVITVQQPDGQYALKRDADGWCTLLDRETRLCTIYDERPQVCRQFHCSRGVSRGNLLIHQRQKEYNR